MLRRRLRLVVILCFTVCATLLTALWFTSGEFRANLLFNKISKPLKQLIAKTKGMDNGVAFNYKIQRNDAELMAVKTIESKNETKRNNSFGNKSVHHSAVCDYTRQYSEYNIRQVQEHMMKVDRRLGQGRKMEDHTEPNHVTEMKLNLTVLQENVYHDLHKIFKRVDKTTYKYFNLSRPKKDHCNFGLMVNGSNICKDINPFLIILIPSAPNKVKERMAIRDTWGRYATDENLISPHNYSKVALAFLMGKDINYSKTERDQKFESEVFQDIVLGDFQDTYRNLTVKMLMGLKWVTKFCSTARYIVKVDDDSYIHIPRLIDFLLKHPADSMGSIYGKRNSHGEVQRDNGKLNITYKEYPLVVFPPYMSGGVYVISSNIADKLVTVSQYMPYLHVEDVFITGILRFIIGDVQFVETNQFSHWKEKEPFSCSFMTPNETKISAFIRNDSLMKGMWLVQHRYFGLCGNHMSVSETTEIRPVIPKGHDKNSHKTVRLRKSQVNNRI